MRTEENETEKPADRGQGNMQAADAEGSAPEEKQKSGWKRMLREWGVPLALALAAAVFIDSVLVVNARIPSGSMENTVQKGDRIFGSRLAYLNSDPERFDIIFFRYPDDRSRIFIKRVIGLPGENVTIVDGKVYINDEETPLDDSFIKEEMLGSFGPYEVPEDCYFVLGDNRNNSKDSRFWENTFVPKKDILGEAGLRYWPLNKIGFLE